MGDFKTIKDKTLRLYFKKYKILDNEDMKRYSKYEHVVKTVNNNIKLVNDIYTHRNGLQSLIFHFNEPEPKYAYIIKDIITFYPDKTKIRLTSIDPICKPFDTTLAFRTVFSVGDFKVLKEAMVEAICCSIAFQYLYIISGTPVEKYFDAPFNFYEMARVKKKYRNYSSLVKILKEVGLHEGFRLSNKNLCIVQRFDYKPIKK